MNMWPSGYLLSVSVEYLNDGYTGKSPGFPLAGNGAEATAGWTGQFRTLCLGTYRQVALIREANQLGPDTILVSAITLIGSAALTLVVRRFALSRGVLDVPNKRSSHVTATPRGGGISIVAALTVALLALVLLGTLRVDLFAAVAGGGVAVATVGFMDDRFSVRPGVRFAVHVAAAVWAVACLGGLPPVSVGVKVVQLGLAGHAVAVLGIAWTLNLFNFMDGIDGIAGSEAVFIGVAGGLLSCFAGSAGDVPEVALIFSGACCGFLIWNWPPAKIFMGDVGSGYLGYVIAALALAATRNDPAAVWVWLILGGVFFVDSTLTLIRRVMRGERVHLAHRNHAYQWLARQWGSHLKVTVGATLVNLLWLLPCAVIATLYPQRALWMVGIAFAPLVVLALAAGSGRRESGFQPPRYDTTAPPS
jgi:Fuc2NAc and GlcNAc transferase